MKKFFLGLFLVAFLLGGVFWFFRPRLEKGLKENISAFVLDSALDNAKEVASRIDTIVKEVKGTVSAPTPLRIEFRTTKPSVVLTRLGVIQATNDERVTYGKPTLVENGALDRAAELKLNDLFAKHYFDHVSPEGWGPDHWVEASGYRYRMIGENLALGNFASDAELVEAWMNSPGHRENILNDEFLEIGAAVGKGIFEGHETWMSVQVFGRSMPNCDVPDDALKENIDRLKNDITARKEQLDALRAEIEAKQERGERAKEEVEEYNRLVEEYNTLVAEFKKMGETYNAQVEVYNVCVEG